MPNHIHLVLRQGLAQLCHTMQPIMCRMSLLARRAYGIEGHVFERAYRSSPCESPDHLRRAICYAHDNPLNAGLCDDVAAYQWSTHVELLTDAAVGPTGLQIVNTLRLFADNPGETPREWRENYLRYMRWHAENSRCVREGISCELREPRCAAGDHHFMDAFCSLPPLSNKPQRDLRDKAIELLRDIDPKRAVDDLRRRRLGRGLTVVRRRLVIDLARAGYQQRRIARYLGVSDTTISEIVCGVRFGG